MSTHRIINSLLALLIAGLLSSSYLIDGPGDTDAAQAQASSLQDATKAAHTEQRMARAIKTAGVAL